MALTHAGLAKFFEAARTGAAADSEDKAEYFRSEARSSPARAEPGVTLAAEPQPLDLGDGRRKRGLGTRRGLIESAKTRLGILEERLNQRPQVNKTRQLEQSASQSLCDDPFFRNPASHATPDAPWAKALMIAADITRANGVSKVHVGSTITRHQHHAHDPRDQSHAYIHGHKNVHHGHGAL